MLKSNREGKDLLTLPYTPLATPLLAIKQKIIGCLKFYKLLPHTRTVSV